MRNGEAKSQVWLFVLLLSLLALGASYGFAAPAPAETGGMHCRALQSGIPFQLCEL